MPVFYACAIAVAVFIAVFAAIAFFLGGILGHLKHGSLNGYRVQLIRSTPIDIPPRGVNTFLGEHSTTDRGTHDHSTTTSNRRGKGRRS